MKDINARDEFGNPIFVSTEDDIKELRLRKAYLSMKNANRMAKLAKDAQDFWRKEIYQLEEGRSVIL